jgi:hypothetical protein
MTRNDPWTDEAQYTAFHEATQQLFTELQKVVDESSFLTYLGLLIADHDRFPRFWTNATTRDFLAAAQWWGGGSFKDRDVNEPTLRSVATMLTAARYARVSD